MRSIVALTWTTANSSRLQVLPQRDVRALVGRRPVNRPPPGRLTDEAEHFPRPQVRHVGAVIPPIDRSPATRQWIATAVEHASVIPGERITVIESGVGAVIQAI